MKTHGIHAYHWPMSLRPRGVIALALALMTLLAACSDDAAVATPQSIGPITSTTSPPTVPVTAPPANGVTTPSEPAPAVGTPSQRLAAKLKAVDNNRLQLGAEFNRQFLGMELAGMGFDADEATCIADHIAGVAGPAFATWTMSQVIAGFGSDGPQSVSACVSTDRLAAIAKRTSAPDLTNVSPDVVRSVIAELATTAFESSGLTATEANCVADAMVSKISDREVSKIFMTPRFDDALISAALPGCLDPSRIATLAG